MPFKFKRSWEQVSPKLTDLSLLKKKPLGVVSVGCSHALFLEKYSFKLFSKNKCQVDWTSYFYCIFCLYLFFLHCGIKKVFDRHNQNLSYNTGNSMLKNQPTLQIFWHIYHKAWIVNTQQTEFWVFFGIF